MHNEEITLNNMSDETVTVGLINGTRLDGKLLGYDDYTVIIEDKNKEPQVVYKTAVTTVGMKQKGFNR